MENNNFKSREPLISIIVPVYNTEKYLMKCVGSIMNQTYNNIEIILVDDGSSDSSPELCDELTNKDNRIRVLHKSNEGLGYARNSGMEIMNGDFCTFIDSDDWVSKDLIENLYNSLISNGVDFCKSGFKRVKHSGEVISTTRYNNEVYNGNSAANMFLPRMIGSSPNTHDSVEMCVCAVLYNANVIKTNSIRFPSERILISEDLVFNIEYMQYANGACTTNKTNYFYRSNDDSLTHRYRSDRFEASLFFYKEIRKMIKALGYNHDTMLRLDRMFFIYIKMSIRQEKKKISGHDTKTSVKRIRQMCDNRIVRKAIAEYPIEKLGYKQYVFLKLLWNKQARLLYWIANLGFI